MHDDVDASGHSRQVEVLAVEERRVAVGEPHRRALVDAAQLRPSLAAVAEEPRRARSAHARGRVPVVVGQAEPALAVALEQREVTRTTELVALERLVVPVVVRWVRRVAELPDSAVRADGAVRQGDELIGPHRHCAGLACAADPGSARADVVDGRGEPEAVAPADGRDDQPRGRALVVPGAFAPESLRALTGVFDELVPVTDADAERFACNALVVADRVVLNSGCAATERALIERGLTPVATPTDEFLKSGGSVKCLVLQLDAFV